jgi:hypothetical protein
VALHTSAEGMPDQVPHPAALQRGPGHFPAGRVEAVKVQLQAAGQRFERALPAHRPELPRPQATSMPTAGRPTRLQGTPDTPLCAGADRVDHASTAAQIGGCVRELRLAQVRVCCDAPREAAVVDAVAWSGVVHAGMPVTLAGIWFAIRGPACPEGPARQCFPLDRRGLTGRGAAAGRYGLAACAWSLAQVSLRPRVRLKTSCPGVESGSGQK